jgi:adenylate kinase family enzyme
MGASGSGTSTLGRALATQLSVPYYDTDDFYWANSIPEFTVKRAMPERLALMQQALAHGNAWVLSGSMIGWGDPVIPDIDLVIFLRLEPALRIARIKARELARYGSKALAKGGERHDHYQAFMQWVSSYDEPTFTGRSLIKHQAWLEKLNCPVIRLNSVHSPVQLVSEIIKQHR